MRPATLVRTSLAVTATAVTGGLATDPDSRWYRALDLPAWQPPPVAFPVVWTALYAAVAVSSADVLDGLDLDERRTFRGALAANLLLNTGWSVVFWRARMPWLAAAEAAALAVSSADLARRAARSSHGAATALAAYAAWCGFATALSTEIARRNSWRNHH